MATANATLCRSFVAVIALLLCFVGCAIILSDWWLVARGANTTFSSSRKAAFLRPSTPLRSRIQDNNSNDNSTNPFAVPNPTGQCTSFTRRIWTSELRQERFPSIEERVCQLMHVWYDPNYNTTTASTTSWKPPISFHYLNETDNTPWYRLKISSISNASNNVVLQNRIKVDFPFLVHLNQQEIIRDLASARRKRHVTENEKRISLRKYMFAYALDMIPMVESIQQNVLVDNISTRRRPPPVVMQFGDTGAKSMQFAVPLFAKWRFTELDLKGGNPIVWRMESTRHLAMNPTVIARDLPWANKTDKAIFRGRLTGFNRTLGLFAENILTRTNYTVKEACMRMQRCALVYNTVNSPLVDSGLTHCWKELQQLLNGTLIKAEMGVADLLRYKMIISVEGNDVASGLKWGLLSNSVILMAPPEKSTFVMEHLLEPWVHYVPLAENMTNVEQRVQWVLENDAEAQRIAQRATIFMKDLLDYPEDEQAVMEQVAKRYVALWSGTFDGARGE